MFGLHLMFVGGSTRYKDLACCCESFKQSTVVFLKKVQYIVRILLYAVLCSDCGFSDVLQRII